MSDLFSLISSEGLLSFLVVMLIISLFVNLFFINSRLLDKSRARKYAKKLPSDIQNYLNNQAYKTANAHKFHYIPKLFDYVIRFRTAYLRIESKCIDRGIDSEEYWNLINVKINELVKVASTYIGSKPLVNIRKKIELIKSLVSGSDVVKDKEKVMECLDNFYRVCDMNSNENKIAEYDKKLNGIILRFTDKYYAKMDKLVQVNRDYLDKSKASLGALQDSADRMDEMVGKIRRTNEPAREFLERCKDNNQQLREGVDQVKDSLHELEQKVYYSKGPEISGSGGAKSASKELSDLSEEIQEQNEREIARLRKVIRDQREVIYQLEEQLDIMLAELKASEGAEGEDELSEAERKRNIAIIESLKNNLHDAEMCIQVLESEVENLKESSFKVENEFETFEDNEKLPLGDNEVASLQTVIDDLGREVETRSKENELLKIVAEFAMDLFKGETFEDMALLIYETLGTMNLNAVLKIYSPTRTFEVCGSGKIPVKLSTVIDNLHIDETSDNRGSFFFRYRNLGGAVHSREGRKLSEVEVSHILMITRIANKALDSIRATNSVKNQNQKISNCENRVKQTFSDVDGAFEKISKNAIKTIESSFRQLREIGRNSGLSTAQIAKIARLESAAKEEINSETVTKLKVRKSILEALGELESLRL